MKNLFILLFIGSLFSSFAQTEITSVMDYKYDETPLTTISLEQERKVADEAAYFIQEKRAYEYLYDENGNLRLYYMLHRSIKINNASEIDNYNKIYIPVRSMETLHDCRARYINAEGKVVTELTKKDVKQLEEEDKTYHILAIQGVEAPGIIEYFYTWAANIEINLTKHIQNDIYKFNVESHYILPTYLEAATKTYNGLPELEERTGDGKRIYSIFVPEIPGVEAEPFSDYYPYLQRIEFSIIYDHRNSTKRLYTFDDVSRYYRSIYKIDDKKEMKALKKFIKSIEIEDEDSDFEKIQKIEWAVKESTILIDWVEHESLNNLATALKSTLISTYGRSKLLFNTFKMFEIDFELVSTSHKTKKTFDPDFNTWAFLNTTYYYFPTINKFLAPFDNDCRLGFIPFSSLNNGGLFLKTYIVLDEKTYDIRQIKDLPASVSGDTLNVNVDLQIDMLSWDGNIERRLGGYSGQNIQAYYDGWEDDVKTEFHDIYLALNSEGTTVTDVTVSNTEFKDLFIKPVILKGKLSSVDLIEQVGEDILFKAGALIGKQTEMYTEKERKLPVDRDYLKNYYRKITIQIPDGYTCSNIENLNMAVYDEDDQNAAKAWFTSTAKIEGKTIIIECKEEYCRAQYPAAEFKKYQRVMNAAADFNKRSILFKKVAQ